METDNLTTPNSASAITTSSAAIEDRSNGGAEPPIVDSAPPVVAVSAPSGEVEKPFQHTDTPTLLASPATASDDVAPAVSPADEAAADPVVPAVLDDPIEAVAPLVYDFKLPEGLQAEPAQLDAVKELFQQHRVDPAVAQAMVDFHAGQLERHNAALADQQQHAFAELRRGWVDQVRSDSELGGAGHNTAMQRIFSMRDLFVPERDQAEFNDFLNTTGAGDNPAFLRFIYRVGQKFSEGAPAPAAQPVQPSKRELNKQTMYDHPRSVAAAGRNR